MTRHIAEATKVNSDVELAQYFGFSTNPKVKMVSINEFKAFWDSLNAEEKHYYRTAKLV